jgi:DNA-binding NtrC family response regulator
MGTLGGGVSRYDGRVFQTLSTADGLYSDTVTALLQDRQGAMWLATRAGLTRYRLRSTPPTVRLGEVMADRRYHAEEPIAVPESPSGVRFGFQGRSFTTRPEGMVYVYRLDGYDADWQVTREEMVIYRALPQGHYTFQVQAVDRDLNDSAPAVIRVQVTGDPRIEGLQAALKQSSVGGEFVGQSTALQQVLAQLGQAAQAEVTVLILGETGTGKGLAARTVHELSSRKEGPFLPINCGAIADGLVESELFGHEKGKFTGAHTRQLGKVELAAGGTLFLDEIGDMPLDLQVKLLRLLEERTFERVGGSETLTAAVRVIAATNRDLEQMVVAGAFWADLFYRLHLFPVRLPPLRDRREDIPELVDHFMMRMAGHLHKEVNGVTSAALARLKAFAWPGNVRELKNVVERAVIVCGGPQLQAADLELGREKSEGEAVRAPLTLEENERQHIQQVLAETGWVVRGAASLLGIPESTLRFRIKKLGIEKP